MAPYPLAVLHWFESNSPKVSGLLTLYWFICVLRLYWKALSTEKWKVLANSLSFPFKLINSIQFLDWLAMSKVLYDFGPSFQSQKIPRQNRTYEKKQFSSVVFPDVACVENHQKPSPSGLNSSTANNKHLFVWFSKLTVRTKRQHVTGHENGKNWKTAALFGNETWAKNYSSFPILIRTLGKYFRGKIWTLLLVALREEKSSTRHFYWSHHTNSW